MGKINAISWCTYVKNLWILRIICPFWGKFKRFMTNYPHFSLKSKDFMDFLSTMHHQFIFKISPKGLFWRIFLRFHDILGHLGLKYHISSWNGGIFYHIHHKLWYFLTNNNNYLLFLIITHQGIFSPIISQTCIFRRFIGLSAYKSRTTHRKEVIFSQQP